MTGWAPARWPLRVRVALAFLGATAVTLTALGVFVHVRMSDALDERLRDTVAAEADRLESLPPRSRAAAVEVLGGDVHVQLLATGGEVRASSPMVLGPLAGPDGPRPGYAERSVELLDDDTTAAGEPVAERDDLLVLVRGTGTGFLAVGTSREDSDEALAQLRAQLLVGGPLALAVAGLLGYAVAGAGLRPIERMRARAATISDRSAGERLPVPAADDELRRLAVTLNAVLERLDEALQRERRFVAEASHDLRTPLTLMLTEIELALDRPRDEVELTAALRSVQDEVRRLVALAEELLGRAAADAAAVPIQAGTVDLVALAGRVADRFRAAAGERTLRVAAPAQMTVQGDATRLDQALSNLLDNALRHGDGAITVAVAVADAGAGAEITVSDEGGGFVPPTAPTGSNGLGLAIVREVARAHGGSVEVSHSGGRTRVRLFLASPDS